MYKARWSRIRFRCRCLPGIGPRRGRIVLRGDLGQFRIQPLRVGNRARPGGLGRAGLRQGRGADSRGRRNRPVRQLRVTRRQSAGIVKTDPAPGICDSGPAVGDRGLAGRQSGTCPQDKNVSDRHLCSTLFGCCLAASTTIFRAWPQTRPVPRGHGRCSADRPLPMAARSVASRAEGPARPDPPARRYRAARPC